MSVLAASGAGTGFFTALAGNPIGAMFFFVAALACFLIGVKAAMKAASGKGKWGAAMVPFLLMALFMTPSLMGELLDTVIEFVRTFVASAPDLAESAREVSTPAPGETPAG